VGIPGVVILKLFGLFNLLNSLKSLCRGRLGESRVVFLKLFRLFNILNSPKSPWRGKWPGDYRAMELQSYRVCFFCFWGI
jgi:hypothetical protein